jgi:hypothetical protein
VYLPLSQIEQSETVFVVRSRRTPTEMAEAGPLEEHLLICCGLSGSAPVDGQVRGGDAYGGKSSGEGDEEEDGG